MQLDDVLNALGYRQSPNLLLAGDVDLESAPAFGHVFRHAVKHRKLKAVYALRPPSNGSQEPLVPIVYVCEAESDAEADETHRLVWNQDVVPFLIVYTPSTIRLYSGFRYQCTSDGKARGLLQVLNSAADLLHLADGLGAKAIDDGTVWRLWGREVRPADRVDWRLLDNLQRLDKWLQGNGLPQATAHALIGKYVYLHYLRDRDILSDRKLDSWNIEARDVYRRSATAEGLRRVTHRLDEWLNGGIFPIPFDGPNAPSNDHVRQVAATFAGDQPLNDATWQLHLDFKAYDFSYIPIETLSVVYEQFLHSASDGNKASRGREVGAYYTPIPLVNFMLAELEDRHPLVRGMRIFDPSCGSGAFLVQCYRRLIEKMFPVRGPSPGPIELRELLEDHIFGADRDPDACSVTELSLTLTLLNYVHPPDLENDKRITLPSLRNSNIFCEDFFLEGEDCPRPRFRQKFDWIVGNPPWKKLTQKKLLDEDKAVWRWMHRKEAADTPVARHQVAQAFVWTAGACLRSSGHAAILLPAMTFFEEHSGVFRSSFLKAFHVQSVANFSNLAEVLFAGRSRVPAAAVFFTTWKEDGSPDHEQITTYSPLVANQETTRPVVERSRQETWSLLLNASELRDIPYWKVADGDGLPWKLATWGSTFDERLIARLAKAFPSLGKLEKEGALFACEGLQLRRRVKGGENVERVRGIVGKLQLDVNELEELRDFFVFPNAALKRVSREKAFTRKGRGKLPLSVCKPPHVIVGASRHFAIYSENFIVVPPRQIGIISPKGDKRLLVALSLFLSSDFAFYHQFLIAPQFGVQRGLATLKALRRIPVPIESFAEDRAQWSDLHKRLSKMTIQQFRRDDTPLFGKGRGNADDGEKLLQELDRLVCKALGLSEFERELIYDLVRIKLELNDGKVGKPAAEAPTMADLRRYAKAVKAALDSFTEGEVAGDHNIQIVVEEGSGLVIVDLVGKNNKDAGVRIHKSSEVEAHGISAIRARLRRERSQWVYFDRNLRIFEGRKIYLLKPMQRFHWTVTQAVLDADNILAEAIDAAGGA